MRVTETLLAILLISAATSSGAQLSAPIRDGLAAAVARSDQAAALVQAELIAGGQLDGDAAAALATLTRVARQGDGHAAYVLGVVAYRAGDIQAAASWWRLAAAADIAAAHYNLGLLLASDPAQQASADTALEAAARSQHVLACFALGTRLAARDLAAARAWLECAASQGYAPAQFNLATLHARAADHADELASARRWYAAAAATFAPAALALAALPVTPTAAPPAAVAAAPLALRDHAWVMAQPASAYTVQVASGASAEVLEQLLHRELHEGDAACVHERPAARQPYSAIVGVYADHSSAERASAALPASLRANHPWVRRYGSLQQALRDADQEAQPTVDTHAESN